MALFPKRIDLDEASLAQLQRLYRDATNDLRGIVFQVGSQDVTIVSVQQARVVINQRIEQLHQDVSGWAYTHVQSAYDQGVQQVINQLESFKHPAALVAAAAIASGASTVSRLHQTAAETLAGDLQNRLTSAITQMQRSTDATLGQVLRENIRAKMANQDAILSQKSARRQILKAFDESGVYALVDKAGKRWTPETYADMASRSIMSQATNTAIGNSLTSQKLDLVKVSEHGATDVCGEFEGSILSLTGSTSGYMTIEDATRAGLFHPNCLHTFAALDPSEYPRDVKPADGAIELPIDEL